MEQLFEAPWCNSEFVFDSPDLAPAEIVQAGAGPGLTVWSQGAGDMSHGWGLGAEATSSPPDLGSRIFGSDQRLGCIDLATIVSLVF